MGKKSVYEGWIATISAPSGGSKSSAYKSNVRAHWHPSISTHVAWPIFDHQTDAYCSFIQAATESPVANRGGRPSDRFRQPNIPIPTAAMKALVRDHTLGFVAGMNVDGAQNLSPKGAMAVQAVESGLEGGGSRRSIGFSGSNDFCHG